jgi:hypothetical protein
VENNVTPSTAQMYIMQSKRMIMLNMSIHKNQSHLPGKDSKTVSNTIFIPLKNRMALNDLNVLNIRIMRMVLLSDKNVMSRINHAIQNYLVLIRKLTQLQNQRYSSPFSKISRIHSTI